MNIMKRLRNISRTFTYLAVVALLPVVANAQDLKGIIREVTAILSLVIKLLIGLALIWFIWEVAQYIGKGGDKKAIEGMVWGVVALFVMVSVWGLVELINTSFGIDAGGSAPSISF